MKILRFEIAVCCDDAVDQRAVRGLIEQHLWWAMEETGAGWIDWKRSLRVYAQVKTEPVPSP
jgi:hypothetical protein